MSSQNGDSTAMVSAPAGQPVEPVVEEPGGGGSAEHPLKKLHRLLRGRYHWAILLGGALAAGGGAAGWYSVEPKYAAQGQIQIKTYVPRVMYQTEETGPLPMAGKFIADQVQLMKSPRVRNKAMESDAWEPYSEGMSMEAKAQFDGQLRIGRPGGTNTINVRFVHQNQDAALAAVEAVIGSYREIFRERETSEDQQRFKVLEEKQRSLMSQISTKTDRIQQIAGSYNASTLQQMYQFQLEEVHRLEQALREAEVALASAGVSVDQMEQPTQEQGNAEETAKRWANMTPQQLARLDSRLRSLLESKRAMERRLSTAMDRLGQNHRRVKNMRSELKHLQTSIDQRVSEFRAQGAAALSENDGSGGSTGSGGSSQQMTVQQLKAKRRQLQSLLEQASAELEEYAQKQSQISELKQERSDLEEQLAQTKQRIERLTTESDAAISGRLQVNNSGEPVPGIVNDGTRKQLAVLGFGGGGGIGVGLILLLGLRDRRLQTADDLQQFGQLRTLGLLPELPRDLADPANADRAAYAVHHIRSMLQLATHGHASRSRDNQTLAITGPTSGTGKTSLTLGLGLSFANSGTRTLLIDCDFGGAGLSHRLQAFIRRRLGRILQRDGLVDSEQLEAALHTAEVEGKRLGEVLRESGVVDEQAVVDALNTQDRQSAGLLDALDGEALDQCVAETGLDNLSILPVGDAQAADTSRLSPRAMQVLVDKARESYDAVLIDAGPLPGSVESTISAGVADQAVLILSRGDQQPDAQRSLSVLRSIHVPLAGVVFNRAGERDLERSTPSRRSLLSRNGDGAHRYTNGEPKGPDGRLRTTRFDPLSRVVASIAASESKDESEDDANNGELKTKQKKRRK